LALPDQCDLVAAMRGEMTIDAIVGSVQLAAEEPLGERKLPVEYLVEGLEPHQLARALAPEAFRILMGALVERFVFGEAFDRGQGAEGGWWIETPALVEHRQDIGRRLARHPVKPSRAPRAS